MMNELPKVYAVPMRDGIVQLRCSVCNATHDMLTCEEDVLAGAEFFDSHGRKCLGKTNLLPKCGTKVLLVGGPYDGCLADFTPSRYVAMHDPDGILVPGGAPDALYAWNLDFTSNPGKINVASASWIPDAEVPPRPTS
jgi:hypothetical protein